MPCADRTNGLQPDLLPFAVRVPDGDWEARVGVWRYRGQSGVIRREPPSKAAGVPHCINPMPHARDLTDEQGKIFDH